MYTFFGRRESRHLRKSVRSQVNHRDNGTEMSINTHKKYHLQKPFGKVTIQTDGCSCQKKSLRREKILFPELLHYNTQNIQLSTKNYKTYQKNHENMTHSKEKENITGTLPVEA